MNVIKKNIKKLTALALCGVVFSGGCGRSDSLPEDRQWVSESTNAESAEQTCLSMIEPKAYSSVSDLNLEPGTTISMILKGSADEAYWKQVKAGAEKAEQALNDELGYKGDDEIQVKISAPSETNDAEDQINLLDEELDSNPNAIVISLIDAEACEVQFDLASENGIPIITMDSGTAYEGIATTCSTDNEGASTKAAKELCNMIEDKGQIALIVHDSISETAQQREAAFKKEIEENHPDVEIVETLHGNDLDEYKERIANERNGMVADTEDISDEEVIQWLLDTYPDLKGIMATDGEMVKMLCSDSEYEEQVKNMAIIGFDAGKDQIGRLEGGWIDGLIVQNPYGMGYASVVAAARTILGESNESVVDTGYVWVTPDNMTIQEIKNLLYE